jgi:hypothetical protein
MKNLNTVCLIISIIFLTLGLWNLGIGEILGFSRFPDSLEKLGSIIAGGFLSLIGSLGLLFQLYFHNEKK